MVVSPVPDITVDDQRDGLLQRLQRNIEPLGRNLCLMVSVDPDLYLCLIKEIVKEGLQLSAVDIDAFPGLLDDNRSTKIRRFVLCIPDPLLNRL